MRTYPGKPDVDAAAVDTYLRSKNVAFEGVTVKEDGSIVVDGTDVDLSKHITDATVAADAAQAQRDADHATITAFIEKVDTGKNPGQAETLIAVTAMARMVVDT